MLLGFASLSANLRPILRIVRIRFAIRTYKIQLVM